MNRNLAIAVSFVIIFFTVIYLALNLQEKNEEEIISMFRKHQMDISLQASKRIESHFNEQLNAIQFISSLISTYNQNSADIPKILNKNLEDLRSKHIKSISIYDKNGTIMYSTSSKVIGLNFSKKDFYKWSSIRENNSQVYLSSFRPEHSEILMVSPLFIKKNKTFSGMISFVINLEELFNEQLLSSVGERRDAWIMDKGGMLLYNPSHSDMVSLNINRTNESCKQCHLSFESFRPLFTDQKGSFDYMTKKEAKKLAAFSTVKFMNINWIVVVNITYDPVNNIISVNFRQTWLLIFLIFGIFCLASILLYRFNKSKIIAETEAKDLREKEELKRRIELSEEKYRKLTDRVTDLLYAFDNDLKYTYWNKAFEKLTGILAKDALGKSFYDIFPDAMNSIMEKTFKQVLKTKESQRFVDEIFIEGKSYHFEIACYPSEDGISVFSRDVTEHIRNEEMRTLAEERLKKYAEELKISNDTKNKLFSIIAHDLRGPFYPIISLAEILDAEAEILTREEVKEYANGIYESSREVFSVVENLLEWSMSQRNCIQFDPHIISLKNEVEAVFNVSKTRAEKKNILLLNEVSEFLNVNADKQMLNSILLNLISNAIKFTKSGGEVKIRAIVEDDDIVISVMDNGIGIPEEKITKMFQIDKNISTRGTNHEKGTGLGLHLCKEFVEKHGGRIWVKSTVGMGSEFNFTIKSEKVAEQLVIE